MDEKELEGSFGAGFALGFFLGIIGIVIAVALDKKQTLKGSAIGCLTAIGIGFVLGLFIYLPLLMTIR